MPVLLTVALSDGSRLAVARRTLTAFGWTVVGAEPISAVEIVGERQPALVLLESERVAAAALARAINLACVVVPVALLAPGATKIGDPFDAVIEEAELDKGVPGWWPLTRNHGRERLAAMLGPEIYAGLLARFAYQLGEALAAMTREGPSTDGAHRIAGLAGTLGFLEVCDRWLPLSEGAADPGTVADAARVARRALQIIAHAPLPTEATHP